MSRIIIAEDNKELRTAISFILEENGYDVVQTGDGKECLKAARASKPDLVITDLIMPEIEGLGLIMELRREFPELPVIAISGGGRTPGWSYLGMAKMLGAVHALSKPFTEAEILHEVCRILEATQTKQQVSAQRTPSGHGKTARHSAS